MEVGKEFEDILREGVVGAGSFYRELAWAGVDFCWKFLEGVWREALQEMIGVWRDA